MDNTSPDAPDAPVTAGDSGTPVAARPLTRALLEIDAYASGLGWDGPARLFALVDTDRLRTEEPELAERLGLDEDGPGGTGTAPGVGGPSLTPIEQDELPADAPLDEFLAGIAWPDAVAGCALCVERLMLPPSAESEIPGELRREENIDALARWVAEHPERQEVRMTVGVLRDGERESALRLRTRDAETEVMTGPDLVPGLTEALAATFEG
ncbi:PPA1309 family protein [Streptomyces calidiresistens]|uniref:Uncharacterized protein n=1 Tax=Streptomyces calidiresistens TaxID=1485586 RepID=A0A7W3T3V5_9ACTN|nr:PPA1309 family protein [Streptomyces calidiresistens]MBB0230475.1 hypothetical protein [Streptomyces calidiresistens]